MAEIITINGQSYVAGLLWQTIGGRKAKADAKAHAKKLKNDLMCSRRLPKERYGSSALQIGLTSTREIGKKATSTPSLAGLLASYREGSWMGAFALPSGHYYAIIVKDGAIRQRGGDSLFTSKKELLDYVNQESKIGQWDGVVSYGVDVDGSESVDLLDILIRGRKTAPKLKLIGGYSAISDHISPSGFALIVLSGLIAAYMYFDEQPQAPAIVNTKAPPPPPPWPQLPAPSALTEACAKIIDSAPRAIGGWVFASLTCMNDSANIQMKRTKVGTYSDMVTVGAVLGSDKHTATLNRNIGAEVIKGSDPLNDPGIQYRLADAIETQGDGIEFHSIPAPLPGANSNQEPPNWSEITFKVSARNDLRSFVWLNNIPGTRLNKITYTPTENFTYKIEGIIYVKKN